MAIKRKKHIFRRAVAFLLFLSIFAFHSLVSADNKANIKSKMFSIKQNRWAKQPRNYPSAGSVFKRPKGKFVGPMIDGLGLKGFTIGGAQISKKHSGFIINRNSASGQDILDLIKFIQKKVYDSEKIHLEIEQRII